MVVSLYPHQQTALDKLGHGKILCGDTGVGKSLTALAYWYLKVCGGDLNNRSVMEKPTDLYIITTPKKRDSLDWQGDLAMFGVGVSNPEHSVGHVNVVVDSWNNAHKYKEVKDAFFIFDEQRVVGSGAWTGSFIKIAKHNGWILLSATPGDTWLDYIPVFVANGFYKNRTEFKNTHVEYEPYAKFPKVKRYHAVGRLVRHRNNILVEMPYARHTKKHFHIVEVDHDKDLFKRVWEDRWHVYEQRPLRDVAELFRVMRKVVNSDARRLRALERVMQKHPRVIVFYNFDYELELLRTLSETSSLSQSEDGPTPGTTGANLEGRTSSTPMNNDRVTSADAVQPNLGSDSTTLSEPEDSPRLDPQPSETCETTKGYWTEDLGDGEMWIPHSEPGSLPGKSSTSSTSSAEESSRSSTLEQDRKSFAVAEWNGHKHETVPQTDSWVYLVQYTSGSEGWNCTDTDAVVFYSLTYSYKQFYQAQGRIDRLNTKFVDLHYYILRSKSLIDRAIWKSLTQKKSFNERSAKISWPDTKAA